MRGESERFYRGVFLGGLWGVIRDYKVDRWSILERENMYRILDWFDGGRFREFKGDIVVFIDLFYFKEKRVIISFVLF